MTTRRTRAADALTDLIIDVLRLNGLLMTAGDRMVARLGLTSPRWQVLRAIYDAERAQPVAWLARDMGGNRQNVQRIVNDLQKMGLVTLEVNPHHRRASLVVLTDKGRRTYDEAGRLQARGRTAFPRTWRSRTSTRLAASSRSCGKSSS